MIQRRNLISPIIALTLAGAFLAAAAGCQKNLDAGPVSNEDAVRLKEYAQSHVAEAVASSTYVYVPQSDLCFMAYTTDETSEGTTLTNIPCTPIVRDLAQQSGTGSSPTGTYLPAASLSADALRVAAEAEADARNASNSDTSDPRPTIRSKTPVPSR